jgi:hypothetical protein
VNVFKPIKDLLVVKEVYNIIYQLQNTKFLYNTIKDNNDIIFNTNDNKDNVVLYNYVRETYSSIISKG